MPGKKHRTYPATSYSPVQLPLPSERRIKSPTRHAARRAATGLIVFFLACTAAGVVVGLEVKTGPKNHFHQVQVTQ